MVKSTANDDDDNYDDNDDDNDNVKAGMNKLARENCRNDGPMGGGFIPPDTLKVRMMVVMIMMMMMMAMVVLMMMMVMVVMMVMIMEMMQYIFLKYVTLDRSSC